MATSIVNGFEPIRQWFAGWWGGHRAPAVVPPPAAPVPTPEPETPEKTGNQATAGYGMGCGWGEVPRGTPATYRQMMRCPSLALVSGAVAAAILSGSWSVDADDDAPGRAKDAIERAFLRLRTPLLRHGLRALHYGYSGYEIIPGVVDGLTVPDYFKALRADGLTIWTTPGGRFAGLSTAADKPGTAQGPTITGPECFLWTYGGEPGELYGLPRLENVRETVAKWVEVQNKIGMLINKESGSVTKVTHPPDDQVPGAGATATTFAQKIASGSAYIAVTNALAALTPTQRKAATVDQIIKLLESDFWGVENLSGGGNGPAIAACQAYSAYLDVQIIRGYLQPERSLIEGSSGTKAEAGIHTDTGTTDCERVEADFVEALNCGPVDDVLEANWGRAARGKVRIVAHPLRDVQESIDTMLIQNVSTNSATADEFYRTFDFDAVAERRGIPKRKTPLPAPEPVAPPAVKGPPQQQDGKMPRLAASRDVNDSAFERLLDGLYGNAALAASRTGYSYSSTQVDIPEPHRSDLLAYAAAIPDEDIDPEDGREKGPHVTVKYGLHAEKPDGVRAAVQDEPAPTLTLGKMGVFPASEKRNSDVLYVSVHSPDLHRLNRKISDAVAHTDTHPGYTPHLTLAYLKPGAGAKHDGRTDFEGRTIRPAALTHSAKSGETTAIPFKG